MALEQMESDHLEIVRGDLLSPADLEVAMKGIEFVYHLARANAKSWDEYLELDVNPTRVVAEACQSAGVKRLVYTGTIDSYYAGAENEIITEKTPLDRNIKRRNYYAQAKAAAESILMTMHHGEGLPVVILRPGIVIGRGGNPFHWGVGMWGPGNICQLWGNGENKLPFVLVADVASALVRSIQVPGIEGRSYNLVGTPLLTSRDYINELQRASGMKVRSYRRSIARFYLVDLAKWFVKLAVNHPDKMRIPSYLDWASRTQRATFDCAKARVELGWTPVSDRRQLIDESIGGSLQSWIEACR
jgi:nucleoside-diphosphate-sugar epimerase